MDLAAELAAFDGKHNDVLEALAARLSPKPSVIRELTELAARADAKLQTATTWLLKRFQEEGTTYTPKQATRLLELFAQLDHWEARLHLLQILPEVAIPADRAGALFTLLKGSDFLQAANKFVRTWSYNALAVLAEQHDQFRPETARLLQAGQEDEAASVRARIRNVLKERLWAKHPPSGARPRR